MTKAPSASKLQLSLVFLIAVSAVFGVQSARADLVPPEEESCQGASAGDTCGKDGTCQAAKCSKIDYQHWNQDASATPPSIEYDCLLCSDKSVPDADAGEQQPHEGASNGDGDQSDKDATPPDSTPRSGSSDGDSKGGTKSSDEGSSSGGGSSSSCSVSYRGLASGFGPWLLAGSVALLVGRRRRVS